MIQFQKLRDIRLAAQRLINNDELIVALFKDIPELQTFSFEKNQEYDDNNYFDNICVKEINGHPYGHDGYDEDEEEYRRNNDEDVSTLPRIREAHLVEALVSMISDSYEFNSECYEFKREDWTKPRRRLKDYSAERRYLTSYLSGETLPKSFFLKNDAKWAIYYAMDHGRFDSAAEFKIFAQKGKMWDALNYARYVIKGRLSPEVENFFFLDCGDEDKEYLKEYLKEYVREYVRESSKQEV